MAFNDNPLQDLDVDLNHFSELFPNYDDDSYNYYYTIDGFNEKFHTQNHSDFSLIHVNIRSLSKNGDSLVSLLNSLTVTFDVICLTETWDQNSTVLNSYFPEYQGFHCSRPVGERGGGVSIFIRSTRNAEISKIISRLNENIEFVFLDLYINKQNFKIGCIYRPPVNNHDGFIVEIENLLCSVCPNNQNIFLCGDFNYCLFKCTTDHAVSKFYSVMNTYATLPLIKKPTRVTEETYSIIDNIFVNNLSFSSVGILPYDSSDHFPIFLIHKSFFNLQSSDTVTEISFRLNTQNRLDNLYNDFSSINFDYLSSMDCETSIVELHSKILEYYNKHCPVKVKKISNKDIKKPWIDRNIKNLIKRRQNLFLLKKLGKISSNAYSRYRNLVTSSLRFAKKKFFADLFENIKNDTKKIWSEINKIINPQKASPKVISIRSLIVNNELTENPSEIANAFNEYFCSIGRIISNSLDSVQISSPRTGITTPVNSFYFHEPSVFDVGKAINSLKNKSSHISTYPVKVLKYLEPILSPILATILKKSFQQGFFPIFLKIARVIPLHKTGSRSDVSNFRPISILSPISKIFEKIVFKQMLKFLDKFRLLNENQYGFRPHRSTTQAILDNLNFIYNSLDSNNLVISIFLDFSKAFDVVDHNLLLKKLYKYGFRGKSNDWLRSYLTDRKQFVNLNSTNSSTLPITHGVPQGSVLGPLLFLLFINDFPNSNSFFKFTLFADDSSLICKFKHESPSVVHSKLKQNLIPVFKWLLENKIKVNSDKSKFIVFRYKFLPIQINPLPFGDGFISQTSCIKFLGLLLDQNLNFSDHIMCMHSKLSRTVGLLYKLNKYIPIDTLRLLYNTLFQPYLIYGIEAWCSAPKYLTDKIFVLQKKSIRAINSLPYNEHTNYYFKSMKVLKLPDLYNQYLATYFFDTICKNSNSNVSNYLQFNSSFHNYPTRNSSSIHLPLFKKSQSQNSFLYRGIKIWNALPEDFRTIVSTSSFRKKFKEFSLLQY